MGFIKVIDGQGKELSFEEVSDREEVTIVHNPMNSKLTIVHKPSSWMEIVDFSTMPPEKVDSTYEESRLILQFNGDNPEHKREVNRYIRSLDMALALSDIQQIYRDYKHISLSTEAQDVLEHYIDRINSILEERGIVLDDIIN